MKAMYWNAGGDRVNCTLCPHRCSIREGQTGFCGVRRNDGGNLLADTFGILTAIHFDPIEKKPLYHFHPGGTILSIGSAGCNMTCRCCQNWSISQTKTDRFRKHIFSTEEIVAMAQSEALNTGVAYTYNEPTIWFEFMIDIARRIQHIGKKNVMVSNGYICREPLEELMEYMDAFNIDLKAFTDAFYRNQTGARLDPVLRTLKGIRKKGRHLEITFLVIPTLNDQEPAFMEMVEWIEGELGNETVLHLSAYHPEYKQSIASTPGTTLERLCKIAAKKLKYVYAGNMPLDSFRDTHCHVCGELLIRRNGYSVIVSNLSESGRCVICNSHIIHRE